MSLRKVCGALASTSLGERDTLTAGDEGGRGMVQSSEVIALLLSVGALAFILQQRKTLAELPGRRVLLMSYFVLLAGRILTIMEGFFLPDLLNIFEHVCYAVSSVLLAIWCASFFCTRRCFPWARS